MPNKTVIYNSQFDFGVGVDSATEQRRGEAVVTTTPTSVEGASGPEIIYSSSLATTQREMEEKLGVSAALSLSCGLFGTTSARTDLSTENALDAYALCLIVKCRVRNPVKQMHGVKLTNPAKALYKQDLSQFKNRYGDMFVNGVHTGGELLGLIRISTVSTAQKEAFHASLAMSGGLGLFHGSLEGEERERSRNR